MDDSLYRAAQAARPRPHGGDRHGRPARDSHVGWVFLILLALAGAGVAYVALDGQIAVTPTGSEAPRVTQTAAGAPFKAPYTGPQTAEEPPPDRAIYARMTARTGATAAPTSAAPPGAAVAPAAQAPKLAQPKPAAAATTPEPAPVAASPAGGFTIQLGAFSTPESARAAWDRARAQAGPALNDLTLEVTQAVQNGRTLHRARAGAFSDRAKAEALCATLQAKSVTCLVARR